MPKKVFLRIIVFAVVASLISACHKENSEEIPPVDPHANGGYLTMKVNGVEWEADLFSGASTLNGLLNISGVGKDRKTLTMTLLDNKTGSYILDIPATDGVAAFIDSSETNPFAYATNQGRTPGEAGGMVTITKYDSVKKLVSGTFYFRMFREMDKKQVIISEGVFDRLPYNLKLPTASGTDTFSVKIDGSLWKPESIIGTSAQSNLAIVGNNLTATKAIGLVMPATVAPGTYDLNSQGGAYVGQYNPTTNTFLASESGKLTILEKNTTTRRIRGTFNFVAKDMVGSQSATLTEGYFSVKYQ